MYQALYRKYRPITFSDVCGQEHITAVLKMQLQKGKVSHAYMFCGSRGTGKTTCAKILAKAVNCENPVDGEPCNKCPSCLAINEERMMDVVEMDAASNNSVDHIRRLCDEVQFLPSEAKKRVYIIDEVHMLTGQAFNALLKTIEEPPSHVLFILATTEINAIPATIMSRCQRFDFKRITSQIIANRLLSVAEKEDIALKKDAAAVIARLSDGALRDALSLLEACQGIRGDIDADSIHTILGLESRENTISLCRSIARQDTDSCLAMVDQIYSGISDFKVVIGDLVSLYRDLLVIRCVKDFEKYLDCNDKEAAELKEIADETAVETLLYQAKALESFYVSFDRIETNKKASAEMLMIRLCHEELSEEPAALLSRIAKLEKGVVPAAPKSEYRENKTKKSVQEKKEEKVEISPEPAPSTGGFDGSVKLKNLLQREPFLKPWLDQITFEKRGSVLCLFTGAFVRGIVNTEDAKKLILQSAKEVDGEIESISFEEKEMGHEKQNQSDFFGL